MALIDVVKWEVSQKEFCHKFPSNDLRIGTQLVVYTAQTAFFVKGGKVLDSFEAGTHTLKSENLPLLNKIINLPFGGNSPFQAEVWFVNQITKLDMKWGTPTPIQLEDPKYSIIVPVRGFGQYGIKIADPRLFLETLIGSMPTFSAADIDSYFKGKLISRLSQTISRKITQDSISILDINSYLVDISEFCNEEINKSFAKYGISLVDFAIMSINVPQDDPSFIQLKQAKATAAQMKIQGKDVYQMQRSFDVLEKAAANEGSGAASMMGIGVGMGFGGMMGGMAQQTINTNPAPAATPPPMPQETTWFVYVNGQQIGGQTLSNLAAMKAQGQINESTLVWKPGMANWQTIASTPELAGLMTQTPPPMPPIPPQM
ncbi:MAG: SPFH domain-containing protein [Bacteroidales bacterium]|nr:SPFH domain-containing protein [Bacteroidales bacterium]